MCTRVDVVRVCLRVCCVHVCAPTSWRAANLQGKGNKGQGQILQEEAKGQEDALEAHRKGAAGDEEHHLQHPRQTAK
jgi:hypothetical protein